MDLHKKNQHINLHMHIHSDKDRTLEIILTFSSQVMSWGDLLNSDMLRKLSILCKYLLKVGGKIVNLQMVNPCSNKCSDNYVSNMIKSRQ